MDRIYVNHASFAPKRNPKSDELPMLITLLVNIVGGIPAQVVKLWIDGTGEEGQAIVNSLNTDKANGLRWVLEGNTYDVMVNGIVGVREETNPKTGEVRKVRYVRIEEGYTRRKEEVKKSGGASGLLD